MNLLDYSPAGDLKIGQVGVANLRIRRLEVDALQQEMRERVERAPALFQDAAVVVDFGGLPGTPALTDAQALLAALRSAGVHPVALAYGSGENQQLAQALGLPTLAKFRAQYERDEAASPPSPAAPAAAPPPPRLAVGEPGLLMAHAIRSGQQVYADGRDLTVLGMVSPGAEVMADGHVHVYGALRGRALAGAQGNTQARIFCQALHAELVAIAGQYIVAEQIPAQLIGRPAQAWLEQDTVRIAPLE